MGSRGKVSSIWFCNNCGDVENEIAEVIFDYEWDIAEIWEGEEVEADFTYGKRKTISEVEFYLSLNKYERIGFL